MVDRATETPTVKPDLFKPGEAQYILAAKEEILAAEAQRKLEAAAPPKYYAGPVPTRSEGFANGVRNFRGGRALVGEEGPEMVDLPKGSNVTPNNQMGGTTVNINFNGPVYGVDDFNEKVNQARLAWERAGNG